jgi:hypothetical protein
LPANLSFFHETAKFSNDNFNLNDNENENEGDSYNEDETFYYETLTLRKVFITKTIRFTTKRWRYEGYF